MTQHDVEQWSPFKVWIYHLLYRNPKSNEAVVDLLELGAGDRLLDVGCGPGAALQHAAATGAAVAGVDPSPSMVTRAANRVPGADVKVGSAEALPWPDEHFTVVINVSSFHHWADREAGLREILRVLAPGGALHVAEGAIRDGKDGHGLDEKGAESLAAKLTELGYTGSKVRRIKPRWRHEYWIVTGIAPG